MLNQVFGILSVCIACCVFYWSYRQYINCNITRSIVLIVFAGFVLRVYAGSDLYVHKWDERYHALVAKNMIEHPFRPMLYKDPVMPYNFKSWTSNHIWVHKQPFPLWAMAGSMAFFGVNEIALRMPSIILSSIAVYFTFFIGYFYFGKKVGLLAAFFHSINGLLIEITAGRVATDHPDIFFVCLVELSIFFCILGLKRDRLFFYLFAGISLGLAILSKWLPALIVLPVWLFLALDSKPMKPTKIILQTATILGAALFIVLPWQIYIHLSFPNETKWESHFNWLHITQALDGQAGSIFYHFNKMRIIWGELIYLPVGWFIFQSVKRKSNRHFSLLIWVFVPFIFFSMVATKMQAYTLFTAPALFIILSWHCIALMQKPLYFRHKIFSKIILALLVLLPIRYCIERVKPFKQRERYPEWVSVLKDLGQKYKGSNIVLFNEPRPIEAMFYTNFTAYSNIPEKDVIIELANNGYLILIRKADNIREKIFELDSVKIID